MVALKNPPPSIPDLDVLSRIGKGSYGEVWLAKGLTGALRAVKIIYRENFENQRAFLQEFEGILSYEPLSRQHPGLIAILHVGEGTDPSRGKFYYYVMELADSLELKKNGYTPRSVRSDILAQGGKYLPITSILKTASKISQALGFLHKTGLSHRDIKPSNILFVQGEPKLADIGLVAPSGQHTFVGTEGFVPPEGPGTPQADLYAFGKVLYEMATGRDRLDFPALPDILPTGTDREEWLALNALICDVCHPHLKKRRIKDAQGLTASLLFLMDKETYPPPKKHLKGVLFFLPFLLFLTFFFLGKHFFSSKRSSDPSTPIHDTPLLPPKHFGFVKVLSEPEGASIYDKQGKLLGVTPLDNLKKKAGTPYELEFRLDGYRPKRIKGVIIANQTQILEEHLLVYSSPEPNKEWFDHLGERYIPFKDKHISEHYVFAPQWKAFLKDSSSKDKFASIDFDYGNTTQPLILTTIQGATHFCNWQSKISIENGYLKDNEHLIALPDIHFTSPYQAQKLYPFRIQVETIPLAHVDIHSIPEGASVSLGETFLGTTPMTGVPIRAGQGVLIFTLDGYRRSEVSIQLEGGQRDNITHPLQRDGSVIFGQKWKNSLGMSFIPQGKDMLVCIWETRVSDFNAFIQATQRIATSSLDFQQKANHPAVSISREDALAFCQWLTKKEQLEQTIPSNAQYLLPSDAQWSSWVGIIEDETLSPSRREITHSPLFIWGKEWPPLLKGSPLANLADQSLSQHLFAQKVKTIPNYNDGYAFTSPVGSFPPNTMGLYDLAGNVYEWVADDYQKDGSYGVLRGSSWKTSIPNHLKKNHRNAALPFKRSLLYGFRIILSRTTLPTQQP